MLKKLVVCGVGLIGGSFALGLAKCPRIAAVVRLALAAPVARSTRPAGWV